MSSEPGSTANPRYALGQLERALDAAVSSSDPAVRARAAAKVDRRQAVLAGMADGELTVGSRTPVRDTPAWVTLKSHTAASRPAGFWPSNRLTTWRPLGWQASAVAGADRPRAAQPVVHVRRRPGGAALGLEQDHYVVDLPEHAALPAVALLLARGHHEPALDLLAQLQPLLHRLRLTPRLLAKPEPSSALVHLEPVGDVRQRLQQTTTPAQVQAMDTTLAIRNPLHDELLALWAETVEGDLPYLVGAERTVAGGWPCRRLPPDWVRRREELLERYERAARDTKSPTRHLHCKSSTRRLVEALSACPQDSSALTGRDVGWIRRILADTIDAVGARTARTGPPCARSRRRWLRARRGEPSPRCSPTG
jgi:hypothetical protein